ncbi:MAG: phosphoglucosamine mutase, partial [Candidatus Thiodiazotropha sp. (ex Notomyrtea botanica)]|nr:phosphoglucosamine mutase [Candidatus Thiodiazotropha sp. (ex Notomyrtea botanica)]
CLDRTTTGDGIVSALQVLAEVHATGRSLRELKAGMSKYPQLLTNIKLESKTAADIMQSDAVKKAVREAEVEMGSSGRVLLRPSGTEPLIRIMVESSDESHVEQFSNGIAAVVKEIVAAE